MDTPLLLCVDGATDVGNRRENNEDAWWAGRLNGDHVFMVAGPRSLLLPAEAGPVLAIVSDGIGGSNAGEVASKMAIQSIVEGLGRTAEAMAQPQTSQAEVLAALHAADAAIKLKATESGFEGMGATLSMLCLFEAGGALWSQAGDSRIYVCRDGKLRQISHDHSPVGRMRQLGEITEAEARRHPLRNQIDQSLGDTDSQFSPEIGNEEVRNGDVFLICSDGLSDGLWDHDIEKRLAAIREPSDVRPGVRDLVNAAKKASGRDNITAIVALAGSRSDSPAARSPLSLLKRLFQRPGAPAARTPNRHDPKKP